MLRHRVTVAVLSVICVFTISGCEQGFADADVDSIKSQIRSHYANEGAEVSEVMMMKESPKKLVGFAKIQVFGIDVTKQCDATLSDDGQYMWRCE